MLFGSCSQANRAFIDFHTRGPDGEFCIVLIQAQFGIFRWSLFNPRSGIWYRFYSTPVRGSFKLHSGFLGTPAWESSLSKLAHYLDNVSIQVLFGTFSKLFNFFVPSSATWLAQTCKPIRSHLGQLREHDPRHVNDGPPGSVQLHCSWPNKLLRGNQARLPNCLIDR